MTTSRKIKTLIGMILTVALVVGLYPKTSSAVVETLTTGTSWVVPAGVYSVQVEVWGGGGGGGGVGNVSGASGGGGGGSYSKKTFTVTPTTSIPYSIGAAGTAGSGTANGGDGGTTTWNTTGVVAPGGQGGRSRTNGGTGGTGGVATGGDVNYSGGAGATRTTSPGGGGGGGAGSGGVGKNASGATAGGSTADNGGAGGAGGSNANGVAGNVYGGGGGGAGRTSGTRNGAAGAQGVIRLTYTVNSSPTVALNSPADGATGLTAQPTFEFTGTDADTNDVRYQIEISNTAPYDISTATFSRIALSVAAQEITPRSMIFNDDGTTLYVMGTDGDDINEYSLSTPYDISTATFSQVALSVSAQDTIPVAMLFNDDGTTLYVLGNNDVDINEYSLSTPYDISTATFSRIALDVSAQDPSPLNMLFNDDGTTLYVTGTTNDDIYEYSLSTPYDISTATFSQVALSVSAQDVEPVGIIFNNDGTKLYLLGSAGDDINEYSLSTPYDISTATFSQVALSVSAQEITARSIIFSNDGARVYVMGTDGDDINEYTLTSVLMTKVSGTDPGFANTVTPADTDPFNSGEKADYDVQAGDALANGEYYWRVRAIDPAGTNTYGEWSATRTFTVGVEIETTPNRQMRLFEGFSVKLYEGKIKLYPQGSGGGDGGGIQMVQDASTVDPYFAAGNASNDDLITATLSTAATAGNLLVTAVATDKNSGAYTVPSGFTLIHDYQTTSVSGAMAYKVATGGETSVTWDYVSLNSSSMWVAEYSGLLTSGVLDQSSENSSGETVVTSLSTGTTGVTSQANELAIAAVMGDSQDSYTLSNSWSNGFTEIYEAVGTNGYGWLNVASKILTTTGTQETTFSTTDIGDQTYAVIATFKGQ